MGCPLFKDGEIKPPCELFGVCGGCTLQNVDYSSQLEMKKAWLLRAFADAGVKIDGEIEVVPSAPYGYREKFQFHKVIIEKAMAGFMAKKSNKVVPVADCPVASPVIRDALKGGKIKIPIEIDRWNVYGRGDVLLSEGFNKRGKISLLGKNVIVDASCFFQSNGAMLEKMLLKIISLAKSAPRKRFAGDFYSGVGTFALFLQDFFENIDLLEKNRAALALAKENLALSGAKNSESRPSCRFFPLSDKQWALREGKKAPRYDFLLADPGREGLSPEMRTFIASRKIEVFCYVSCNYKSLARDAARLTEAGFALESLILYDFYPQTTHIESLAVFRT